MVAIHTASIRFSPRHLGNAIPQHEELYQIVLNSTEDLPNGYKRELLYAIRKNTWKSIENRFVTSSFVNSDNGDFILAGPFIQRRGGEVISTLSALSGKVDHGILAKIEGMRIAAKQFFDLRGYMRMFLGENPSKVTPYHENWNYGLIGGESGEAFIVPDSWQFDRGRGGPALLNLTEQRRRFDNIGAECIRRIFDEETAELLISAVQGVEGDLARALDYGLHDIGHSSGFGFRRRLEEGRVSTIRDRAIEEYWASGMEYWAADWIFGTYPGVRAPLEKVSIGIHPGKIVAASCCTMFGMDIHRPGGEGDFDVLATSMIFDTVLWNPSKDPTDSPTFVVDRDKIRLTDPTYDGLIAAFRTVADRAYSATIEEGFHKRSGQDLFNGFHPSEYTFDVIRRYMIEPCRGLYQNLS